MLSNIKGEEDMNTYEIRFSAIHDNFVSDHNKVRYKGELQDLKHNVGSAMDDDDSVLKWLYKRICQELSFVTGSKTVMG